MTSNPITEPEFITERRTCVMVVRPPVAAAWLERTKKNRRLDGKWIAELANMMVRGEWKENGASIIFGSDGSLIDGQHRLTAVVRSGISVQMSVAFGLDPEVFITIDRGKRRSFADMLGMRGVVSAHALGGAVSWLWRYRRGLILSSAWDSPSAAELMLEYEDLPDLLDSLHATARAARLAGSPGMTTSLHYLFAAISPPKADEFFELLATGTNMSKGHPVLTLRERLNDDRAARVRLPKEEVFVLVIRAWNAFVTNRPLTSLKISVGGVMPMIEKPTWTGEVDDGED